MSKKFTLILIVVIISLLGASVASAQGPRDGRGNNPPQQDGRFLDIIATATGLERDEIIRLATEEGKTLAQIISENGGDVAAIQAEIVAALTADVEQRVSDMLNNPLPVRDGRQGNRGQAGREMGRAVVGAAADALGMEPQALFEAVAEGQSLADYVAAQGGDVDAIKAAAIATLTEQIDTALAEEKITQERADSLKAELENAVDTFLNRAKQAPRGDRPPQPGNNQ